MRSYAVKLSRLSILGLIILMLFSLCLLAPVKAEPCAILKVSLPDGTYVGPNSDPWLSECWLLNLTGTSQTFTVRINNTSAAKRSYDTHLIIALNDAAYTNLEYLVVNGTSIPKSAFRGGTPTPFNLWTWPSGDVYPTWFNDTYVNVGTIPRKGYKEVVVSVAFSNATGVMLHFDAYGSRFHSPPSTTGAIAHNSLSADSTVLVQPGPSEGQPPIADFLYDPSYPNADEMVILNASGSYDPDGYIVSYSWDFGDETPIVIESDPMTNHTYTAFGNYTVILVVTDNDGLTDNSTVTISVRHHPVAAFTFTPSDPLEHETITLDASSSTADGGVIISYEWNFGDGNITTVPSPIINHTYSTFGNYTVTLNVTDSEAKWDTESKPITVEALPIADFWWSPLHPIVCENVTFDGSDSTPDGGVLVSYAWNFGDGSPVVIENDTITTHHYLANGSFTVTLNITDSEGRWDTESKMITVGPRRHYLAVETDPADFTTILGEGWYDNCTYVDLTAPDFIPNATGVDGQRFDHWDVDGANVSGNPITVHMDANHTATAHYVLQYLVTFNQSGVAGDFNGTVVTIDGIPVNRTILSISFWWDNGTEHNFSFASPLVINESKRCIWKSTSGLSSSQNDTLTIASLSIFGVTGHYIAEFNITFSQTGIGSDFDDTIVIIDGTLYDRTTLPVSFWWEDGSTYNFSFQSPLVVTPNVKQYVWESTTGLSTLQTGSVTVTTFGNVTGNYKTQYYLTLTTDPSGVNTPSGEGWHDAGTYAPISTDEFVDIVLGSSRYRFTGWTTANMSEITAPASPSTTVYIDEPKTVTANYKTQYLLTVLTRPAGLSPRPTRNPAGEAGPANRWWYDKSTSVELMAQNVAGHTFCEWTVDGISRGVGANPISVMMDTYHTAIAHYDGVCVGGYTTSLKSPLLLTWISLNAIVLAAIFVTAFWIKRQLRRTS